MGGVAGETAGTVSEVIPSVVARRPGEGCSERVDEVEKCPGHEHVVVCGVHEGDHDCGQTNTWEEKVRDDAAESTCCYKSIRVSDLVPGLQLWMQLYIFQIKIDCREVSCQLLSLVLDKLPPRIKGIPGVG